MWDWHWAGAHHSLDSDNVSSAGCPCPREAVRSLRWL